MESTTDNVRSQMRKGVLEYCILCILSKQEAYASSIIDSLKAANMIVVEGTLYPLLIRQKNQGLLTYRWEESTMGLPRKAAPSSRRWTPPGRKWWKVLTRLRNDRD